VIVITSPLGGTADDAERWWRAYLLAENDQAGELRQRADAGDEHARRQLASWLAERAGIEEAIEVIRPLAGGGDDVAELSLPAGWLTVATSMSCANALIAAAITPYWSWPGSWPGTNAWTNCASSWLIAGSCWRAGGPGSMT
jgi:hypothetical protein